MCGIAGFAGWSLDTDHARRTVRAMCDAIIHRGPDGSGYFVAPEVALGMRRLAIIDVAGGQQPIGNEDGSIQVVFNGEIYNHHELRDALRARGHRFRTRCDTETIVHLYEEHGDDFVVHLRGMFAIALWDERRKRLVLARDRVGIKPLSYWVTPDGIAFCSELRSLLTLPRFPRRLDQRAIAAFLSLGYVPDPLSAFAGVAKLPPGHILTWSADRGAAVRRYWTPVSAERAPESEDDATEHLRELLGQAVTSHLESEVPLGAFLSGGLDSSTVVALMAGDRSRPPHTFAIGFAEQAYNEAPHARRVAAALGTRHTDLGSCRPPTASSRASSVCSMSRSRTRRRCPRTWWRGSRAGRSPSVSRAMGATSCSADTPATSTSSSVRRFPDGGVPSCGRWAARFRTSPPAGAVSSISRARARRRTPVPWHCRSPPRTAGWPRLCSYRGRGNSETSSPVRSRRPRFATSHRR